MTARYQVLHTDGRITEIVADDWTLLHLVPNANPSPCAHVGDNRVVFDPRVQVKNLDTGEVEYGGRQIHVAEENN